MKNKFLSAILCLGLLTAYFACEKDDAVIKETTNASEKGSIDYGITTQEFLNSKAYSDILYKFTQGNTTISNRTDSLASQLSPESLLDRLDLGVAYLNTEDNKELLNIPVRTQGNYKRVLLSLSIDDFTNSYLLTYPDSTNSKLYYVSTLDGLLLQKITIGNDGFGINKIYNSPNSLYDRSTELCYNTTYNSCSAGLHNFAWGNADECTFWTNPGGKPPSKASILVACGDTGSGSTGNSNGSSDGNGSGETGGGVGDGDDGFEGVPPKKGGDSLVDDDECVDNLDCEDCNFGPIDLNNDCDVSDTEITINQINNCMGGVLTGAQKNLLANNPQLAANAYGALTIICKQDAQEFLLDVLEIFEDGDEVDFENKIIKDSSFIDTKEDCVLNELISTNNNLFKQLSNAFTDNKSQFKLKFTTFTENSGAVFRTSPPDSNGIVEIKLNLTQANGNSVDIAATILHETIHAELHRIYISNNAPPYNYPEERYKWLKRMYEYYQNINPRTATTNAQHFYMAQYFITPLRDAVREYDQFTQTNDYYEFLAWDGLQSYGIQSNLITQEELDNFENLTINLYNDDYESSCNN